MTPLRRCLWLGLLLGPVLWTGVAAAQPLPPDARVRGRVLVYTGPIDEAIMVQPLDDTDENVMLGEVMAAALAGQHRRIAPDAALRLRFKTHVISEVAGGGDRVAAG